MSSGNNSKEDVLYSVGKALNEWNVLELSLMKLFSSFLADIPAYKLIASHSYGAVRTFEGRLELLRKASEAYFGLCEETEDRKELQKRLKHFLGCKCQRLSSVRNNIAHGYLSKEGFNLLIEHTHNKDFYWGPSPSDSSKNQFLGMPKFKYTANDLDEHSKSFCELSKECQDLAQDIFQKTKPCWVKD